MTYDKPEKRDVPLYRWDRIIIESSPDRYRAASLTPAPLRVAVEMTGQSAWALTLGSPKVLLLARPLPFFA